MSRQPQYFSAIGRRTKDCVVPDDECTGLPLHNGCERGIIVALEKWYDKQIAAKRTRCCKDVSPLVFENYRVWGARKIGCRGCLGDKFAQELESFAGKLGNKKVHPREVAFWPIQTG